MQTVRARTLFPKVHGQPRSEMTRIRLQSPNKYKMLANQRTFGRSSLTTTTISEILADWSDEESTLELPDINEDEVPSDQEEENEPGLIPREEIQAKSPRLSDIPSLDREEGILATYSDPEEEITAKFPKPPSAPSLTIEMLEEINEALDGPPKDVVASGFCLKVLRKDLAVINDNEEWLIDVNMDFYLELIRERSQGPGYPKVYIFHSFFYTLLTNMNNGGYEAVKETTGDQDIFQYDLVFIPVNVNHHWRLVVLEFSKKRLLCYDSMQHDNSTIVKAIAKFLKREYLRKHWKGDETQVDIRSEPELHALNAVQRDENGIPIKQRKVCIPTSKENPCASWASKNAFVHKHFNYEDWDINCSEICPQQENAIDCGIFVLQYAEYLSRKQEFDFNQRHVAYFRKRMIYETLTKKLLPEI